MKRVILAAVLTLLVAAVTEAGPIYKGNSLDQWTDMKDDLDPATLKAKYDAVGVFARKGDDKDKAIAFLAKTMSDHPTDEVIAGSALETFLSIDWSGVSETTKSTATSPAIGILVNRSRAIALRIAAARTLGKIVQEESKFSPNIVFVMQNGLHRGQELVTGDGARAVTVITDLYDARLSAMGQYVVGKEIAAKVHEIGGVVRFFMRPERESCRVEIDLSATAVTNSQLRCLIEKLADKKSAAKESLRDRLPRLLTILGQPNRVSLHINCANTHLSDLALTNVTELDHLRQALMPALKLDLGFSLDLSGTPITDDGIANLLPLTKLRLSRTHVGDAGLAHLCTLKLKVLDLSSTRITDAATCKLSGMKCLEELDVSGTKVGDASAHALADLTTLRVLKFAKTRITNLWLERLPPAVCRRLTSLDISDTVIDNDGMIYLASMSELTTLNLAGTNIRGSGPEVAFLFGMDKLTNLSLAKTNIGAGFLHHVSLAKGLQDLDCSQTGIGDGLAPLLQLKRWKRINLTGTQVSDASSPLLALIVWAPPPPASKSDTDSLAERGNELHLNDSLLTYRHIEWLRDRGRNVRIYSSLD